MMFLVDGSKIVHVFGVVPLPNAGFAVAVSPDLCNLEFMAFCWTTQRNTGNTTCAFWMFSRMPSVRSDCLIQDWQQKWLYWFVPRARDWDHGFVKASSLWPTEMSMQHRSCCSLYWASEVPIRSTQQCRKWRQIWRTRAGDENLWSVKPFDNFVEDSRLLTGQLQIAYIVSRRKSRSQRQPPGKWPWDTAAAYVKSKLSHIVTFKLRERI